MCQNKKGLSLDERVLKAVCGRLELEVVLCVIVADILYHLAHALLLITCERYDASLDVVAEEVAESAAEILVTWIREERAGVCQHTHET